MRYPAFIATMFFLTAPAFADDVAVYRIVIKDHKFQPEITKVPADKAFKIVVENQDATPEEFESQDFKREKIVGGGKTINVPVGALKAGEYKFYGEFHADTAQGKLIVE